MPLKVIALDLKKYHCSLSGSEPKGYFIRIFRVSNTSVHLSSLKFSVDLSWGSSTLAPKLKVCLYFQHLLSMQIFCNNGERNDLLKTSGNTGNVTPFVVQPRIRLHS